MALCFVQEVKDEAVSTQNKCIIIRPAETKEVQINLLYTQCISFHVIHTTSPRSSPQDVNVTALKVPSFWRLRVWFLRGVGWGGEALGSVSADRIC